MGCASGRVRLRSTRTVSKICVYDEGAAEACECGRVYPEDALYCCRCGMKRPQAGEEVSSSSSPKHAGPSPFSDLATYEPSRNLTVPQPQRRSIRSGSEHSSTTTSSNQQSVMSGEPYESRDSDDRREEVRSSSSRCSSRCNSNASTATFQSIGKLSAVSKPSTTSHKSKVELGSRLSERRGSRESNHSTTGDRSPRPKEASDADMHDITPGSVLAKALKHSGSFVMHTVRMRAMQAPDSISCAHNAALKPDNQMPLFEAKVDSDNLIEKLPPGALKPDVLSLQRVSFMSTEWLGIRLEGGTPAQCMKFCLCVAALQNIGKNTSRSVVVETHDATDKKVHPPGFACAPVYDRWASKKSQCCTSFLEHAEDISELADIVLNESRLPAKKVTAELKKWCQRSRASVTSGGSECAGRKTGTEPRRRSLGDKTGLRIDTGVTGSTSSPSKDSSPKHMRERSRSMPDVMQVSTEKRGNSAIQAAASFLTSKKMSVKAFVGALEDQFAALAPRESGSRSPPAEAPLPVSEQQPHSPPSSRPPSRKFNNHEAGPPMDAARLRKRRKSAPELGPLGDRQKHRRHSDPRLFGASGEIRSQESPRSAKELRRSRHGSMSPFPLSAMPTLEEDQAQEYEGDRLMKVQTMPNIHSPRLDQKEDEEEEEEEEDLEKKKDEDPKKAFPAPSPLVRRRRSTGDIFNQ